MPKPIQCSPYEQHIDMKGISVAVKNQNLSVSDFNKLKGFEMLLNKILNC